MDLPEDTYNLQDTSDMYTDVYDYMRQTSPEVLPYLSTLTSRSNAVFNRNLAAACMLPITLKEVFDYITTMSPARIGFITWKNMKEFRPRNPNIMVDGVPYDNMQIHLYRKDVDGDYRSIRGIEWYGWVGNGQALDQGRLLNLTDSDLFIPDVATIFNILSRRKSCNELPEGVTNFAVKTTISTIQYLRRMLGISEYAEYFTVSGMVLRIKGAHRYGYALSRYYEETIKNLLHRKQDERQNFEERRNISPLDITTLGEKQLSRYSQLDL